MTYRRPIRLLGAPIEKMPPRKVVDVLEMRPGPSQFEARTGWTDLGHSLSGYAIEYTEKGRYLMTQVPLDANLLKIAASIQAKPGRLAVLWQAPESKHVHLLAFPLATLFAVDPGDVIKARQHGESGTVPIKFEVTVEEQDITDTLADESIQG